MDHEPRTRQLREYLWFALILMAILMGSAVRQRGNTGMDSGSMATLTVSSTPH